MKILIALLLALAPASVMAQAKPHDPFRGAPFAEEPKTPPLVNAENDDRKRVRSYAMQPPTIPHKTENYQVDRFANRCLMCHARTRAPETQATPISITHYTDRDGTFLADVSPRRYFCEQCHVVQMQTDPVVETRFRDVEQIIKSRNKK
ncbi:MAG TPA: nitrate reductase cytochrome c-type subunit [Burkholderiales bacterium]|nr:nitrate reductase cytochrome c-type subunit [Burkholderiales bacterium]